MKTSKLSKLTFLALIALSTFSFGSTYEIDYDSYQCTLQSKYLDYDNHNKTVDLTPIKPTKRQITIQPGQMAVVIEPQRLESDKVTTLDASGDSAYGKDLSNGNTIWLVIEDDTFHLNETIRTKNGLKFIREVYTCTKEK
jgi:hypothetical protein